MLPKNKQKFVSEMLDTVIHQPSDQQKQSGAFYSSNVEISFKISLHLAFIIKEFPVSEFNAFK